MEQHPAGTSLREIRAWVDKKYGAIGPSTNTPFPPEGI
jgi:hypothetical protein